MVQDFGIKICCEPVGVDNPVNMQLIRSGLFDRWFEAMRKAAADRDGTDPIRILTRDGYRVPETTD